MSYDIQLYPINDALDPRSSTSTDAWLEAGTEGTLTSSVVLAELYEELNHLLHKVDEWDVSDEIVDISSDFYNVVIISDGIKNR